VSVRPKRLAPIVILLLVVAMLPIWEGTSAEARPARTIRLRPGASAFWQGAVPSRHAGASHEYVIVVTGRAPRLRVAVDHGGFNDVELRLTDPAGKNAGWVWPYYSGEIFVRQPRPGRWRASVTVHNPDTRYRMRATLDRPERLTGSRPLLPNLRMVPPFELTFRADPIGFPPAGFAGLSNGCFADEVAAYGATRCLRFSTGPGNVGDRPGERGSRPEPTARARARLSRKVQAGLQAPEPLERRRPLRRGGQREVRPSHWKSSK
jgi:hypothetical protein